jgi:FG-GAP-like repeat
MELQGERMNPMRILRPVLLTVVLMLTSAVQVYSQLPPPPVTLSFSSRPLADTDGDGKVDIVLRHIQAGDVEVWLMNGTTIARSAGIAQVSDFGWQISGKGDLNGDGKSDLVWHHATTGQVMVWLMNGLTITRSAVVAQVNDLGWQIAGVADVNGDRKSDLVWYHTPTGVVVVWLMNGLTITQAAIIAAGVPLTWQIQ